MVVEVSGVVVGLLAVVARALCTIGLMNIVHYNNGCQHFTSLIYF